ncbi:MAG: hypothetical protein ACOYB3_03445, partial [Azonexus sp.]
MNIPFKLSAMTLTAALGLGAAGLASAQSAPPPGPYMSPNAYQTQQQAPQGNPNANQAPRGGYYGGPGPGYGG